MQVTEFDPWVGKEWRPNNSAGEVHERGGATVHETQRNLDTAESLTHTYTHS